MHHKFKALDDTYGQIDSYNNHKISNLIPHIWGWLPESFFLHSALSRLAFLLLLAYNNYFEHKISTKLKIYI